MPNSDFTLAQKGEMIDAAVRNAAEKIKREFAPSVICRADISFWLAVGREYCTMAYASTESALKET
jgi:hypothetical protein